MRRAILPILLLTLFASCGRDIVYEETQDIDRYGWRIDSVKRFEFEIQDTTSFCDMSFLVRNTGDYDYQNLWFFVEFVKPDMTFTEDTVQLFLADDFGKWVGSGIGSIYSATYEYRDSIRFDQTGKYLINIRHGMRTDSLQGITDIGVQIKLCE